MDTWTFFNYPVTFYQPCEITTASRCYCCELKNETSINFTETFFSSPALWYHSGQRVTSWCYVLAYLTCVHGTNGPTCPVWNVDQRKHYFTWDAALEGSVGRWCAQSHLPTTQGKRLWQQAAPPTSASENLFNFTMFSDSVWLVWLWLRVCVCVLLASANTSMHGSTKIRPILVPPACPQLIGKD